MITKQIEDEQRPKFEAFMLWSRNNKGVQHREKLLERGDDGCYVKDPVQRHWWTWLNALESNRETT